MEPHADYFGECWCSQALWHSYDMMKHRRLLMDHDLAWLAERGLEPYPEADLRTSW